MGKFSQFFKVERIVESISSDIKVRDIIRESVKILREASQSPKVYKILAEAKSKDSAEKPESQFRASYRRKLTPEEESLITRYQKSGSTLNNAIEKVFGDQGYLPAVNAWLKALGLDQDGLKKLRKGETEGVDFNSVDAQEIRRQMKASGKPIIPTGEFAEEIIKSIMRDVARNVASGYNLTPVEKKIYEAWKTVTKQSGQIVGNKKSDVGIESPEEDNPFISNPERYDDLMLRARKSKFKDPDASDKDSYFGKIKEQNSLVENNKILPDEISLNIEDAFEKIMKMNPYILNDEDIELAFLNKIKNSIISGRAFVPSKTDPKSQTRRYGRWGDVMSGSTGVSTGITNPYTNPGFTQMITGAVRPIHGVKGSATWGKVQKHPKTLKNWNPYIALDKDRVAFPDKDINEMYRKSPDVFKQEMLTPAKMAANYYFKDFSPSDRDDAAQEIAIDMFQATGLEGWRDSENLRKYWAKLYAWHYRDKMFRQRRKEQSNQTVASDSGDEVDRLGQAAVSNIYGDKTSGRLGDEKAKALSDTEKEQIKSRASNLSDMVDDVAQEEGMDDDDAMDFKKMASILNRHKNRIYVSEDDMEYAQEVLSDLIRKYPGVRELISQLVAT